MAFLTINGVDIPTAYGGQYDSTLIGGHSRAISGTLLRDARAMKRTWRFKTYAVAQSQGESIMRLVQGLGQHFAFDTDGVSDSGLTPSSGYTGAIHYATTCADGSTHALMQMATDNAVALQSRTASIWPSEAVTNLLTAEASNMETDTGGDACEWTEVGNTISQASNVYWQGTKSLALDGSGSAYCSCAVSGSTDYTFSAWIRSHSGDAQVTLSAQWFDALSGSVGSLVLSDTVTAVDGGWRWLHVTGTSHVDAATVRLNVNTNAAIYVDGAMVSQNSSAVPWVVGQGSRVEVAPRYGNPWPVGTKNATMMAWINGSSRASAGTSAGVIWLVTVDGNNYWSAYIDTAEKVNAAYACSGVATTSVPAATTVAFGDVTHMAVTLDAKTGTQSLYLDGTLEDSDSISACWDFDDVTELRLGEGTAQNLDGYLDQLVLLPCALTAAQISDVYNSGVAQAVGVPQLICSGDFVGDSSVTCLGSIVGVQYQGVTISGAWANNAMVVEFELMEI